MEVVDRVIEELRPIADKLGEGAEFLWQTLIRQMYIRGVISVVVGTILLTFAVIVAPKAIRRWSREREDNKMRSMWSTEMLLAFWSGLIPTVVAFIGVLQALTYGIPRLINPAYYAFYEILRTVR